MYYSVQSFHISLKYFFIFLSYIPHCYILLAKLFDKIIAGTTACGEQLVGRKLNFKLAAILTGVMMMIILSGWTMMISKITVTIMIYNDMMMVISSQPNEIFTHLLRTLGPYQITTT